MLFESYMPKKITFHIEPNFVANDLRFLFTIDTPNRVSVIGERKGNTVIINIPALQGIASGTYEARLDCLSESAQYLQCEWREKIEFKAKRGRPPGKSPVMEYEEIKESIVSNDVETRSARIGDKVFRRFSVSPSAALAENFDDVFDFLLNMDDEHYNSLDDEAYLAVYDLLSDMLMSGEMDIMTDESPVKQLDETRRAKKSSARKRRMAKDNYRRHRTRILQKRKLMKKSGRGKLLLKKRKRMAKAGLTAKGKPQKKYNRQDGGDRRRKR
jgi:hypothetical protein